MILATDDITNLLNAGIQAAKNKRRAEARRLLEQVLEADESNETAWMWLASVVDTPREKRICLENVLELNPDNVRARETLAQLGPAPQSAAPSTPTQTSPPASAPAGSGRAPSGRPRAATGAPLPVTPSRPSPLARAVRRNPTLFLGGGGLALLLILVGLVL